ncbi:MAG: ABC transporter permease, partial [Bacteroidetes bacterium]|nr:ABC transporter permease [Bacteroidota bacterium]
MLRNFALAAFRNLIKRPFYAFINIFGLAVGIGLSFLIFQYVNSELSVDSQIPESEIIFRLGAQYTISGKIDRYANVPRPLGPNLTAEYPQIESFTRLRGINRLSEPRMLVEYKDDKVHIDKVFFADSTFFDVFSRKLIQGNSRQALTHPNSIVLTQSTARKLFGDEDPFQKQILVENQALMLITGVMEDDPGRSHLPFDGLVSWSTMHSEADLSRWVGGHVYTYIKVKPGSQIEALKSQFPAFYEKFMKGHFEAINGSFDLFFQPLEDIYLNSHLTWEAFPNGNRTYVIIFLTIAIFLLLIAGINYMNLSTARASERGREVGMRKILGSSRKMLVIQFLTESVLLSLVAGMLASIFLFFLIPLFNQLSGQNLDSVFLFSWFYWMNILLICLGIGVFSGIYPAFYLAGFEPIRILKNSPGRAGHGWLRKGLVVFQFSISVILIVGTLVINRQMEFIKNKDLGFKQENILAITIPDTIAAKNMEVLKEKLFSHPGIISGVNANNLPGQEPNHTFVEIQDNKGVWNQHAVEFMEIGYDFVEVMEMELLAGRNFDRSFLTDPEKSILINQTAAQKFRLDQDPVGKQISFGEDESGNRILLSVVGVLGDFHMGSMHREVGPIISFLAPSSTGYFYLKLKNNDLDKTLTFIEQEWNLANGHFPFEYKFIDDSIDAMYQSENKLSTLFKYFALIAILISSLGLMGLVAYNTTSRFREISIRKVFGASIISIIQLINREFLSLVLVANLIAIPIYWYIIKEWLDTFTFHIEVSLAEIVIAVLGSVLIAM